jgi:uracil-DNA glycosylase family 4
MNIATLNSNIIKCNRCPLVKECNQIVPGIGSAASKLLIVGEATGTDDDIIGEPFTGRAGQLLTKLLSKANISRESTYITNAVKCRPPNNRTPSLLEIKSCKVHLWNEIQVIQPQVILTLGRVPTSLLLRNQKVKMKDVVGKFFKVEYIRGYITPWYHPNYLLNQGNAMDDKTIQFFKAITEHLSELSK